MGSSTTSTVKFDLASTNAPASNDLLQVNGNLSIPGANTFAFNMLNSQLASGTYKLVGYTGTLTGSVGSISTSGLGSGTTRQTFSLSTATAHEIDLIVGGSPASLTWTGGLGSNAWDINTTQNWTNNGTHSGDKFYNLDAVAFDNTGSNSPNINIAATVQPGNMIFNNTSAKTYTFTGTGDIGGGSSMNITGGGTVILANTGLNNYSGATQITSGTLQIGDGGADGSLSAGSISLGGTLIFNQSSSSATAATNVISGAGTLQKLGAGTLTLITASASFTGPVSIGGGTVVLAAANAIGPTTATAPITIGNLGALDIGGYVVGTRPVSVQGAGPDGVSGAIVSSATADQQNAFTNVTLTGNTTFGGTGRWDIRGTSASLAGGGYTLTKTGTNSVYLVGLGNTNLGAVIVNGGNLGLRERLLPAIRLPSRLLP